MVKFRKTMALMLALALVLTTFGAVTVSAASFGDTQGHWAESVIDKWSDAGVVNGYSDGTFLPDNNITRAELAKVISTAKQFTTEAEINFSDVAPDEWYVSDLKKCVAQGVIGGYEDGTFKPENEVTREEAAAMFQRAYQINSHGLIDFADSDQISTWATTAISSMVGTGIINGYEDNTFRPAASITRAEVVKILDGITAVATEPGASTEPGQGGGVSSGGVVNGGLGGSAAHNGYFSGGVGGGSGGGDGFTGYPVVFNANGGQFEDGKEAKTVTISNGSVVGGAEPVPTRVETVEVESTASPAPTAQTVTYLFAGWYRSKAAADSLDDTQKWDINNDRVTSGVTLYAGWYKEGEVVVSFNLNGGNGEVTNVAPQAVKTGGFAAEPAEVPTRTHYTFTGWYSSPTAAEKYDFAAVPVYKDTTLYAGWQVDAEFAAVEVSMPDTTVGTSSNGKIIATPAKAIPGETIVLRVISPDGFKVRTVKALSYISATTGETVTVSDYTLEGGKVTFILPEDVQEGTVELNVSFTQGTETEENPVTPPPADTDPDEGPGYVSYKFSGSLFEEPRGNGKMTANTDFNGFSISKDCDLDANEKEFADSIDAAGEIRTYTHRLKIGTNEAKISVLGPCDVTIDACSASSEDRTYDVKDDKGTVLVDDFMCKNGATPSCQFRYEGSGGTLTIKGNKGINLYGVILYYGEDFVMPTAAPTAAPPTADPNLKHAIKKGEVANGDIVFDADQQSIGQKVTITTQPNEGYEAAGVYTNAGVGVTREGDNTFSFTMPYSDVTVSARFVKQNAQMHSINYIQTDHGSITVKPKTSFITASVFESTENFLYQNGGMWAISGGSADGAVYETTEAARKNDTNKLVVTDSEAVCALPDALEGPFTLSYDVYTQGDTGQAFRTYLDNKADEVDPATGKTLTSGNDNAFFHMTNIKDRIYATGNAADLELSEGSSTGNATQLSRNEFEDNRWFKVMIKGDTRDDTATVEFYRHTTNGDYSASSTVADAEISGDNAPFVSGRDKSIKQIRLGRATSGTVYYDNVKLQTYNDDVYSAYEGEEFTVTVKADLAYEIDRVIVTDAAGNVTEAQASGSDFTVTVPSSDATISAEFVPERPAPAPEGLAPITDDYEIAFRDYISSTQYVPTLIPPEGEPNANTVYLSGGQQVSEQNGNSVVGSLGEKSNCMRLNGKSTYIAIQPAFDAVITVYGEQDAIGSIGMGLKPGSCGLYVGERLQAVHTLTVKAGTCVFITGVAPSTGAGQDYFVAGLTVTHAGAAAAAQVQGEDDIPADEAADAIIPDNSDAETTENV